MVQSIQRLRYFDGEFLRSGDFADEQAYHIAMRRLLNRELHLYGIVRGLKLVEDQNSAPGTGVTFCSVTRGFAIDQLGREIYVPGRVSLTPLLDRAGVQTRDNEVWIVYKETPTGTAAAGYQLCDQPSQNTRWTESFDLVLWPTTGSHPPGTPHPNHDLKGVRLGVVTVSQAQTTGLYISVPSNWWLRRSYAKIRAQSVVAPDAHTPDPVDFSLVNIFPPEGYIHLDSNNGVYTGGNAIIGKNVLVGEGFDIPSAVAPGATVGHLKLGGNLYLKGKLYKDNNNKWITIEEYLKNLATPPDIKLADKPVTIEFIGNSQEYKSNDTATITSSLLDFSSVDIYASLAGYTLKENFTNYQGGATSILITRTSYTKDQNSIKVSAFCLVTRANTHLPFSEVKVALMAIFRP